MNFPREPRSFRMKIFCGSLGTIDTIPPVLSLVFTGTFPAIENNDLKDCDLTDT